MLTNYMYLIIPVDKCRYEAEPLGDHSVSIEVFTMSLEYIVVTDQTVCSSWENRIRPENVQGVLGYDSHYIWICGCMRLFLAFLLAFLHIPTLFMLLKVIGRHWSDQDASIQRFMMQQWRRSLLWPYTPYLWPIFSPNPYQKLLLVA